MIVHFCWANYCISVVQLINRSFNLYNATFISPLGRKFIPYFILLFISGYIFSDNFLRFIEFHSDVKVKQIKPVISGESDEETVTPRFPNLMICSFQRIVQKYIGGHALKCHQMVLLYTILCVSSNKQMVQSNVGFPIEGIRVRHKQGCLLSFQKSF